MKIDPNIFNNFKISLLKQKLIVISWCDFAKPLKMRTPKNLKQIVMSNKQNFFIKYILISTTHGCFSNKSIISYKNNLLHVLKCSYFPYTNKNMKEVTMSTS